MTGECEGSAAAGGYWVGQDVTGTPVPFHGDVVVPVRRGVVAIDEGVVREEEITVESDVVAGDAELEAREQRQRDT